jgi:hypothetical protein
MQSQETSTVHRTSQALPRASPAKNIFDRFIKTKIKNKTYYNGQHMKIYEFQRNHKKRITRQEMIDVANEMRKDLKEKYGDGIISVSIKYPNRWYSGEVSYLNEDINFFTMDDYDEFDEDPNKYQKIRFNFIPIANQNEGGSDPHNDCLINCIRKCIINPYQKGMIKAEDIKKYLGIERDDMISIDMVSKVEEYINNLLNSRKRQVQSMGQVRLCRGLAQDKYAIMVSGASEYISQVKSNKVIRIILSNRHYSLDSSLNRVKGKAYTEKKILLYSQNETLDYDVFDGKELFTITQEEYKEYNDNPITSPYLLVSKGYTKPTEKLCLEEAYERYIKMADIMKEKTNGRINFYKTGSVKKTALNYFYEMMKTVQPDAINNNEAQWIEDTTFGALTYWKQHKGNIHSYDINSNYPNVMSKNFHYFPIKEGEYITMTKDDFQDMYNDNFKDYSIYRCVVEKPKSGTTKFFRFNQKNKYTHLDLQCAKEYGLNIKLIVDGKPNCLYYSKDKLMNGAYLFRKYINEMYELKSQKIEGAKLLLNILWGSLCEMNYYNKNVDYDENINYTDADIRYINSSDEELNIKCIFYKGGYYKTTFARMKPFLISYARKNMFRMFRDLEDNIVRIHTDGFYCIDTLPEEKRKLISDKMGYLKYEGMKEVNITGLNKIK